jgi:hypothetical protein
MASGADLEGGALEVMAAQCGAHVQGDQGREGDEECHVGCCGDARRGQLAQSLAYPMDEATCAVPRRIMSTAT